MSKSLGQKIGVKFTEELVSGTTPSVAEIETQAGDWTANGTYSGTVDTVKDDNTGTYWQSRSTSNYIQINRPNTKILGVKVYKGSSYRPLSFTLRKSNDGVSYEDVRTGAFEASTGWETIAFDPVEADYFRINFGYSSRLYLYELILIVEEYDNLTINDFVVTGQEYKYINGELIEKRYKVAKYEPHPTEPKSLLLTIDNFSRFPTVEGDLTITYDASKGNLAGAGGAVESFTQVFTPTDLIPEPNPHVVENITAQPYIDLIFTEVTYHNAYAEESITASPASVTAELIHTSIINP